MTKGAEGHVLHGGAISDNRTNLYQFQNGEMRCGLTVVTWVLTDHGAGDGGFACIPGSHKSNYQIPDDVARLEADIGVVRQVEARAGSAIIFTEALGHGTFPWKADHERRTILYKYSPGPMSYSQRYLPEGVEEALDEFTPEQRAVLEPPYASGRPMGLGHLLNIRDCVIRIVAVELGLFSFAESFCDILCHFQETERDGACYAPIRRGTPTKVRP